MRRGYARSCWGTTAHAGTLLIAAAAALAACDRTRSEPPPRQAPARIASAAADSIALDSCARLDAQARPQQRAAESAHADPPPHPGSWTATKRLTFDGFSIDVPAVVTLAAAGHRGRSDHRLPRMPLLLRDERHHSP
jgi:hypothetical protein